MAKVMSLSSLENKPSRDGFDLSNNEATTAKFGQFLPIRCIPVLPDDKFDIDLSHFTRTMPLNTAAFVRATENIDVFFVPYSVLWTYFNNFWNNRDGKNMQNASDLSSTVSPIERMPYASLSSLRDYIGFSFNPDGPNSLNAFGLLRSVDSSRLLTALGCGDFINHSDGLSSTLNFLTSGYNPNISLAPLAAYQKVYYDWMRFQQWEDLAANCYDFSYITSTSSANLSSKVSSLVNSSTGIKSANTNMFDLRYVNYERDLFFGVYPDSQLGDEAIVSIGEDLEPVVKEFNALSYLKGQESLSLQNARFNKVSGTGANSTYSLENSSSSPAGFFLDTVNMNALRSSLGLDSTGVGTGFSILQLRLQQVLQRYREIIQSGNYDLRSQMKKIWNVSVPEYIAGLSYRIGGYSTDININEVVNNNLAAEENQPEIAGKGVSYGGKKLRFDCSKCGNMPGILLITYYARPQLRYSTTRIQNQFTLSSIDDFANPVFDKLGMEQVHLFDLCAGDSLKDKISNVPAENLFIGYAPRYIKWKTDVDRVSGGFLVEGLRHWTCSIDDNYVSKFISKFTSGSVNYLVYNYNLFKVNPAFTDPLFYDVTDSSLKSDRLLINMDIQLHAVRSLDYTGMPY